MSKGKELIKNTIVLFIGRMLTQFSAFLMLPLYTAVLSSEEYGLADLITTYSTLVIPLVGLQLEMGVFRYLIDNRKVEKNKTILITNTLLTIIVSTFLFSVLYVAIAYFIALTHLWLILASTVAMLLSNYFLQVARGLGDNIGYAIGSIIAGISTVLINVLLLLVFHFKIDGVLIATALANLLCVVFLVIRERIPRYINLDLYDKKEVARVLRYSAPLIPNSLIWWVINVSDRTIISIFMSMSANGIYSVSNKFSSIISAIYNVFNLSWTESASLHINDPDRDEFFSNTFNTMIKVFTSVLLLMLAFMPMIFKVMVGVGYEEAYLYIPVLAIGMIFNTVVSFIGAIYIAKKKTKEVAMTSFWSGILNIGINIALINIIGIWAAVLSTVLAFLIMSFYRYYDVQKYVKLKLDKKTALLLLALIIICVTLYYINTLSMNILNMVFVTAVTAHINKGIIKSLMRTIKIKFLN